MKKSLILLSIIITALSYGSVKGFVEVEGAISSKLYKDYKSEETKLETKLKGEIKVENTGFSAGLEIKSNGNKMSEYNFFKKEDSKVWAKYAFPKFYGIGTSLKAETNFDLNTKFELEANTNVSNYDIFGKLSYGAKKVVEKNRSLDAELGFNYKGIKDVELGLKALGGVKFDENKAHAGLEFNGKLKTIPSTELKLQVKAIETVATNTTKHEELKVEIRPEAKYANIVTVEGKLEGVIAYKKNGSNVLEGSVKSLVSVLYDYKPIEVVTLTPKFTLKAELTDIKTINNSQWAQVIFEPELKVEYRPVSGLKLGAIAQMPLKVTFQPQVEINGKGILSAKYEW
ncbi:hypothetical protein [Caviibacter abscessus]|uniref:hypothetical protein n=1 Tax=Caviibacter abscessus TaxID=1766719 RepID=UPI000838CBB2|nr:hypothetical protein [Caviibacter abscessus]